MSWKIRIVILHDTNITSEFKQSTEIWLPDSVTTIGDSAFYGYTSLTSVIIPDSVTSIGNNAFQNCIKLTSATMGNNVTSIGNYTFGGCSSLTRITIPDSVTTIGDSAFERCSRLTQITIGNSSNLTSIGHCAFKTCKFSSMMIPLNVTFIGYEAFSNNTNLTNVTCKPTSPSNVSFNTSGMWNAFGSNTSLIITVPRKSLTYTTAEGWKEYKDKIRKGVL